MTTAVQETKHHPTYMRARGRCWAQCACGWKTNPGVSGNQAWAQLEFAAHLGQEQRA